MRTQLEELKKYGYEIYVSDKHSWAYIITPSNNISLRIGEGKLKLID